MENYIFLILFLNLLIFKGSKSQKSILNNFKNYTNDSIVKVKEKRKLEDEMPLNIYLDLYNFNYTFPNETLRDYKDMFIQSMNKAKVILQEIIISINFNYRSQNYEDNPAIINKNKFLQDFNLSFWNDTMYKEGESIKNILGNTYNYYIFFNFGPSDNIFIHGRASAKIVLTYNSVPCMGVITINKNIDKSKLSLNYLTYLMIHEFTHLIGFHIPNDDVKFKGVIGKKDDGYYIAQNNIPRLILLFFPNYFSPNFPKTLKLELDEDGNIHWPSRLFLGDYMANIDYPEEIIFSHFTLEFLYFLYYIKVNDYTGGLMKFGYHKGNNFFNKSCGAENFESDNSGKNKYIFGNEFYLPNETNKFPEPSCSSGRLSKTVYKLHPIDTSNEDSEEVYEFFLNGYAGPKATNYCPIAEFYTPQDDSQNKYFTGSCSDPSTLIDINYKEELGNNSFCFLSSLVEKNTVIPEVKAVCYKMSCEGGILTIKIGNRYILCPLQGGKIVVEGFDGYFLCPDYLLMCRGTVLCNNLLDCIEKKSGTKSDNDFNDFIATLDLETTQNSSIYSTQNPFNY